MCGIAAALNLSRETAPHLRRAIAVMNGLQRHRGPDGEGAWLHPRGFLGLGHRRLAIIDVAAGSQPMSDGGRWVTCNGEIYNHVELREELGATAFRTHSDTEVVLRAYERWGEGCLDRLRGMFAFALWDESRQTLVCARDRFGMKPLYYAIVSGTLYVASEIKALLPFLDVIQTDTDGLQDYLTFQYCLDGKTLFAGVHELLPGHLLTAQGGTISVRRYWDLSYVPGPSRTARDFEEELRAHLVDAVAVHLRSDVPVGAYLSGGLDSSIVASLAADPRPAGFVGFHGKFSQGGEAYDESRYARDVAAAGGFPLHELDITEADFVANISRVVYHLDAPVAGPGSFPQYMVSELAGRHVKVVLGGQGGDEVFGGYVRYLIATLEQGLKEAIDGPTGASRSVSLESILPSLGALREYRPLLQDFWREGLFDSLDRRYFRLVDRSRLLKEEIRWDALGSYSPFEAFRQSFNAPGLADGASLDRMSRFDLKTLLPALLQVEDRVSMAHGLESRAPLLDHPLVEMVAAIPASDRIENGVLKGVLKRAMGDLLPPSVGGRRDKMGFPVPLREWLSQRGAARELVLDVFASRSARERDLVDNRAVIAGIDREPKFGRKIWALLCLELWQRAFHDRAAEIQGLLSEEARA